MGFPQVRIRSIQSVPVAVLIETLACGCGNGAHILATGFVNVVAEEDNKIEVFLHHVSICRVITLLKILARCEGESDSIRSACRRRLRAADFAECRTGFKAIPVPSIRC